MDLRGIEDHEAQLQEKINRGTRRHVRYEDEWRDGRGMCRETCIVDAQDGERRNSRQPGRVEGHSRVAVLCLLGWPRHLSAKHTCPDTAVEHFNHGSRPCSLIRAVS